MQFAAFAVFFAFAVAAAAGYHSVVVFTDFTGIKSIWRTLVATLYSLAVAALIFFVNLHENYGRFRVFELVGLIVGATIYLTICRDTLDKAFRSLYNFLKKFSGARNEKNIRSQEAQLSRSLSGVGAADFAVDTDHGVEPKSQLGGESRRVANKDRASKAKHNKP